MLIYLPIKNENSRYLESCLTWAEHLSDKIAIYDDQSNDDSVETAKRFGSVKVRPDGHPSFLENESQFREAAWKWMEETLHPKEGDWCFALDADEFLVADTKTIEEELSEFEDCDAITLRVPEIFGWTDVPQQRVDGFWGSITATRLCRYKPGGSFRDVALSGGSLPSYVQKVGTSSILRLLHVGYLHPEDRQEKYERYMKTGRNHSSSHIRSILTQPKLIPYEGFYPKIWRGNGY